MSGQNKPDQVQGFLTKLSFAAVKYTGLFAKYAIVGVDALRKALVSLEQNMTEREKKMAEQEPKAPRTDPKV